MISIECLGSVVRDPYTNDPAVGGKKKYTSVTLVTNRWAGSNPDGTPKYDSVFLNCVAFERTAELLAKVTKGEQLWVRGDPSIDNYEKDGKVTSNLKCVIREMDRVRPTKSDTPAKDDNTEVSMPKDEDDDPFS